MNSEAQWIAFAILMFGSAIFCAAALTVEAVWTYLTN